MLLWVGKAALVGFLLEFAPIAWAESRGVEDELPYFMPMLVSLRALFLTGIYFGAREAFGELAGMALLWLLIAVSVICLPLLVFPRVRRALWSSGAPERRAEGERKEGRSRREEDLLRTAFPDPVPLAHVVRGTVTRRGKRMTVVLHRTDGSVVGYSARGRDGEVLRDEFRQRLADRLVEDTTGGARV